MYGLENICNITLNIFYFSKQVKIKMAFFSGVLAQQNKTKAHVVVKGDKEVKVGDPLSLECYGSVTQLSFYIKHR